MPLKNPIQLSSLADYKKLVQADAKALSATGARFQYFSKFMFPDKTAGPIILFGLVNPDVMKTVIKQCTGPASGSASINGADQIELEVDKGTVLFAGLARALAGWGVTRKLAIPLGAEESEEGGPPKTVPSETNPVPLTTKPPVTGQKPVSTPPTNRPPTRPTTTNPGVTGSTVPKTPTQQPTRPTGPQPTATGTPPVRVQPRGPQTAVPQPKPTGFQPPVISRAQPRTREPQTTTPQPKPTGVQPRVTPQPQTTTPQPKPTGVQPPVTPQPKTPLQTTVIPPKTPVTPQKPTAVPPTMVAKQVFDGRFKDLSVRLKEAYAVDPNGAYVAFGKAMIAKAKASDFKGALQEAQKLDVALGKASFQKLKATKQQNRSARLGETFNAVKKSYFTPGSADIIAKEKLNAGKTFKAFLTTQKAFETARDEKTLDDLEKAARDYLTHFETEYSSSDKKKKESIRKKTICETALKSARHFRLALEQDKLGNPPWDEEKEMKAAELYTKLLFEQDEQMATPNDPGAGVNGAFWIEKTVWGDKPTDTAQKKTFIFKPADAEAPVAGFPKGGSAAREMLGKAVGDQLQASMGLDFAFPESTIVAVDSSKLPDENGKPGPVGVPRSGSIQHFAKSKGELKKLAAKDPTILASIPDDEIQKMAVLDLVQLNMDRHSGNFMVGEKDGGTGKVPRLVPIDNGLCLPSRAGLDGRRTKLGPPHNALGDLPGAQKKMAPEMVEKIKQINPDEVVAGMKKAYEAMKKLHPEAAAAAEVTDANFELAKRSILFLQKASTELTVAELQDAYVASLEKIFDTPSDKMDAGFDEAIKTAKARGPALQELAVLQKNPAQFEKEMRALGWGIDVSKQAFDAWVRMNPAKVVKIYKAKMQNPVAVKKLADLRKALSHLPPEKTKPTGNGLEQEILTLGFPMLAERNSKAKAFGIEKPSGQDGEKAEIYEELGGTAALQKLDAKGESLSLNDRVELMMKGAMAQYGGDPELAKITKLYPDSPIKTPVQKYQALKAWKEYQALGGDGEFFRLGGGVENAVITQRLTELKCMKEFEQVA